MTDLSGAGVRVLVIGTSTHHGTTLPSVPSVARSFHDLLTALVQRCGVRPDRLRPVLDPPDAQSMAAAITAEAQAAETVLLVYFIGHGLLGPAGELYLAASSTDRLTPGMADYQALSFSSLRQALGASRASSVVVVLDCCFSGRAGLADRASVPAFPLEPSHGLYLIGSAEHLALAPPDALHTSFTGAFIDLLTNGDPRGPGQLTLDAVYDAVFRAMRDQDRPWPRRQAGDRSGNVVIAPNPAVPRQPPATDDEEPAPGRCPYPGLDAFRMDDADVFFGRERMTAAVLTAVAERAAPAAHGRDDDRHGPLVLVGPSGSGKTSLLHAGFLARLRADGLPGLPESAGWPCLQLTPGTSPLQNLAAHLDAVLPHAADLLREDPSRAVGMAQDMLSGDPGRRLILMVDQLEELFTLCPDPGERTAFLRAVAALSRPAGDGRPGALVLLALRADFYGQATAHPELLDALRDNQVLIEPMKLDELRAAIARPAASAGLVLDGGLADVILHELGAVTDAEAATGALPLLSHVLWATWQHRAGARLTVAGYRAAGGITRAIATTADQVYSALDEAAQESARRMLLRLVRVGEDSADTARPVARSALLEGLPDADAAEVAIREFGRARLLTLDRDTVRISHEALLQAWPLLRDWLDADRDWLRARQQLSDDATTWERAGRDPSLLYRGNRLAAVQQRAAEAPSGTQDLPQAAADFLTAGDAAARQSTRRRRMVIAALTVLALVASAAGIVATVNAAAARKSAEAARAQHVIALSRQLTAQGLAVDQTDPLLSRQLATAAWSESPTPQAAAGMASLLTEQERRGMLVGHAFAVDSVAFSPSGDLLASGDSDGVVKLWNPATHQAVGAPIRIGGGALGLAFSPNGTVLAGAGGNGTIELWNPATHQEIGAPIVAAQHDFANAVAFNPSGTILAGATSDGRIRLWNPATRQEIGAPITVSATDSFGDADPVESVAFDPSGTILADTTQYGAVQLWDVSSRKLLWTPVPAASRNVSLDHADAVFGPSGTILATADSGGTVRFWDTAARKEIGAPITTPDTDKIRTVLFNPNGTALASADGAGVVRFWDPATEKEIGEPLTTAPAAVHALAFSPRGGVLATAEGFGVVQLWNPDTDDTVGAADQIDNVSESTAAFSPRGPAFAYVDPESTVQLRDSVTGQRVRSPITALTSKSLTTAIAFNSEGTVLAASDGPTVHLWDPGTGRMVRGPIPGTRGGAGVIVSDLVFSPAGSVLAIFDSDGKALLWNTGTQRTIGAPITAGSVADVNAIAFNPSGTVLAVANEDGTVRRWDTATAREIGHPIKNGATHTGGVNPLAFSPDGRTLATANDQGIVQLWNATTGQKIGDPISVAAKTGINTVEFSPNGSLLATGSKDLNGTVRLWDPATGREVGIPNATNNGKGAVLQIAFSADGSTFRTLDQAGTTQLWETDMWAHPYQYLCAEAGRLPADNWTQYAPGEQEPPSCA